MNPALKLASALFCAGYAISLQQAFAEDFDIALYGGTTFNNDDVPVDESTRKNSVSISAGVRLPALLGDHAKLRGDISYIFGDYSVDLTTYDPAGSGQATFVPAEFNVDRFMFHVGPVWDTGKLLGRFTLSAGAQVGLAHSRLETTELTLYFPTYAPGDPTPTGYYGIRRGGKYSSTDFSYQFPVGLDFAISDRMSVGARYRAVHISGVSSQEFEHIAEGGIRFKF